jgi:hypothetical protein
MRTLTDCTNTKKAFRGLFGIIVLFSAEIIQRFGSQRNGTCHESKISFNTAHYAD